MKTKFVALIAAATAAAVGLAIGGLIGHFATKGNAKTASAEKASAPTSTSPAPTSAAPTSTSVNDFNKPNPVKDTENRNYMFEKASADKIREVIREYSQRPHLAGSARNNKLADIMENTWKSYGFETKRSVFDVLLSYPGGENNRNQAFIKNNTDDVEFESQKEELPLGENRDPSEIIPPFNGYAKAGDVTRDKAYYVNYCRVEDFDYLTVDRGENLTDSLVICRYGKIFRGNKVKLAQEHGAVGVIIYNDPEDCVDPKYGNATFDGTFPNSWFLPPSGVQRGSVMEFSGDPLTPGYPAKEYATRKSVDQIRQEEIIPKIPTQPIGYGDAEKFLNALGGDEVAEKWKGGISGLTYKYGGVLPGGKKFRLLNNNRDEKKNITNVFGYIKGGIEPDRYVLLGNHRDAWMNGAVDAVSGTAVMMEASRVFSELMNTGWRPRRTIIFCSWDAEEYGLIGSIEWLDEVRVLLADRAVAYINCDIGVVYNQLLEIGSSPLTFKLIYDTAKLVALPGNETGKSLYDKWLEITGNMSLSDPKPHISDLGAGSDHTGFFHRHGITSMDVTYTYDRNKIKVTSSYPLYHTSYETFTAVEKFNDPTFLFHRAMTQLFTELGRSLADSVAIPFVVNDYAIRLVEVYDALNKSVRPRLAAKDASLTKSLDFLKESIDRFEVKAAEFDTFVADLVQSSASFAELRRVNDQLMMLERAFLYPLGVLNRKYIKHVVFAPSATDSYASAAFPGISDALFKIEDNDEAAWENVKEELTKAVYSVESATQAISKDIII